MLSGTGAPAVSAGHDGDFYLDTTAGVLYGPKASGTWPATGISLTGPQGSPGTGATVASLAAGDTRCGNGGASITDGTGNTAYACNGGTGALDLHSFSVASTAALTLTPGQAPAVVPGLSVQVTPAIASTYFVNADIWLALNVTATTAACGSFADGLFIGTGGSYGAVDSSAPNDTIPLSGAVSLSPGAHTIDIRCTADSSSANVGGRLEQAS